MGDTGGYETILWIRDPRDVFVSAAYWLSDQIEAELGCSASIDEKLMWVIQLGRRSNSVQTYQEMYQRALAWAEKPNTYLFRFEDLIGKKGGGDSLTQRDNIGALASVLGIQLSKKELLFVARNLWGNASGLSGTFRNGTIGSWRAHFKPEHKVAFKEEFHDLLIQLGYEQDNDS